MRQRRLCEAPHSLLPSIASADSQLTESAEEQITTLCVRVCKVWVCCLCVCVLEWGGRGGGGGGEAWIQQTTQLAAGGEISAEFIEQHWNHVMLSHIDTTKTQTDSVLFLNQKSVFADAVSVMTSVGHMVKVPTHLHSHSSSSTSKVALA